MAAMAAAPLAAAVAQVEAPLVAMKVFQVAMQAPKLAELPEVTWLDVQVAG